MFGGSEVSGPAVSLVSIREAMAGYAGSFDPALITASDATSVVEHAACIEKMAATVCALAAGRVAETSLWKREGDRSAAHHLARKTGKSVGDAVDTLRTAKRMDDLPEVSAAARRGDLSSRQASAIADAAAADPTAETDLVNSAARSSLGELRDQCARTKAAAIEDGEARRRRIHARRYLRNFTDSEGAFNLHFRDNPEVGAEIMSVIRPLADRIFAAARKAGHREPTEAYAADALAELARCHGSASAGTRVAKHPGPTEHPDRSGSPGGHGCDEIESGADGADESSRMDAARRAVRAMKRRIRYDGAAGTPTGDEEGLLLLDLIDALATGTVTDTTDGDTSDGDTTGIDTGPPVSEADGPDSAAAAVESLRPPPDPPPNPVPNRAKIVVRVDLAALLRGYPQSGEVCEIAGYGPVAVSAVHDMIDTADPFLTAVATDRTRVLGVAHLGRRPNAHQQTALEWLYPTCAVEGCAVTVRLENDHRKDWATTHLTVFDLLDRLCSHHHALKTRQNWSLIDGRGKRAFVSIDDPRHPNHARPAGDRSPPSPQPEPQPARA